MTKRTTQLKTKVSFEPTRLALNYLADGYECLVPIHHRSLRKTEAGSTNPLSASRMKKRSA